MNELEQERVGGKPIEEREDAVAKASVGATLLIGSLTVPCRMERSKGATLRRRMLW